MKLYKINILKLFLFFLLVPLVYAETTFFDQDDMFVMGNSNSISNANNVITEGATGEITGEAIGGSVCIYHWNCTDWSECFQSGKQNRNCTNLGTCLDTYNSPDIVKDCNYFSPELDTKNNKLFIYFISILTVLFIVIYVKRDYFKRIINNLILKFKS